jgi:hypothetical protein
MVKLCFSISDRVPVIGKLASSTHGYYVNLAFGMGMSYPASPLGSPVASPSDHISPFRMGEQNLRFHTNMGILCGWNADLSGYFNENSHLHFWIVKNDKGKSIWSSMTS